MSLANGVRSPLGFDHIGATLKQIHGDLLISKQKLRKIERIELIRLNQDQGQKNLAFTSRPFVLCGLPLRRPPQNTLLYERRNGHFKLQITGHPDFGLPYEQDRLIPIFLATLAVRQQSQTVHFKSGATVLEMFGMSKGGKEYRRIVAAFERIFGATIFLVPSKSQLSRKLFIALVSTSCEKLAFGIRAQRRGQHCCSIGRVLGGSNGTSHSGRSQCDHSARIDSGST